MNDIQKYFKMSILEYAERMRQIFEMEKLLPPSIRNIQKYDQVDWDTRDMTYKEYVIRKVFKYGPPIVMYEQVKENFGEDYRTIPTDDWIDLFGTLQVRDDRMRASSK